MADTYRVILTAGALTDLQEIAAYIRQDSSPKIAAAVERTILEAIDALVTMPARFKRVGISRKRGTPIHARVIKPFIIYYRVEDRTASVYVLHVMHGRRRQPKDFT